jgi:co-chaperonin GroES (HSP10)
MDKQNITEKLKKLKEKTELLRLSEHRALGDYLIVVPVEIKEPGITARAVQFEDRPEVGLVTAVGAMIEDIEPGDVIFFGKYSHVQVTHDDIIYLIMRSEDVYCVANNS